MLIQMPDLWGFLCTPNKWRPILRPGFKHVTCGGDNLAFSGFRARTFRSWLHRIQPHRDRFSFVAAPDVVGNTQATLDRFPRWERLLHRMDFPVAFVLQDGITPDRVPWQSCEAVFVGGSTAWKMSDPVLDLLKSAGMRGKYRHIGRVNSVIRYRHFHPYAESCDGTGITRYVDRYIDRMMPALLELRHAPKWSRP